MAAGAPPGPRLPRGRPASRWWFWPLLVLCLAPPAAALWARMNGSVDDGVPLLLAWIAAGFLSGLLLLVGAAVHADAAARALCCVPLGTGLAAAGGLVRAEISRHPGPDGVIPVAGMAALLLGILLLASASVARWWRLWAFLVFAGALAATAFFR